MNQYESILHTYWGHDHFRGIQKEIIESIGNGHDTLGLMPTGGGKSITFQVPALCMEGVCIVVTPLIALMKDQVQNLSQKGIKATAIYTGLTRQEILVALDNCILGDYKFLYVSPERLGTELFITKLNHMKVSFIAVDEAHCISQWGYDFRPSYLRISSIRKMLPDCPILALTATATPNVVKDIQEKLEFREGNVFRMSFERKNLAYVVRNTEDKVQEAIHILNRVPGSAIIYVRNRKGTKEMAELLKESGISATFYHAGLSNIEKDIRQKEWQEDKIRVMVATNAFGMGIDKPDVRTVIHLQIPDSPEAYFQEAGRGGRDGKTSYAVLLYHRSDRSKLLKRISEAYPEKEFICNIYEHLAYYYQMAVGDGYMVTREFDLEEFCIRFKHFPLHTYSALKLLVQAGYLEYNDEQDNSSRVIFTVSRDELYGYTHLDDTQECIIRSLLRTYTGIFTDYSYIEESRLAHLTGLTSNEVYEILKGLSHIGLIHYIPRKRAAYITYTQKRVEKDELVFHPEVYEERKKQLESRIKAMVDYAENESRCRSELLLHYFGETDTHPCGHCDNCSGKEINRTSPHDYREHILQLISDGQPHLLTELTTSQPDSNKMREVLKEMIQEEEIEQQGLFIRKK